MSGGELRPINGRWERLQRASELNNHANLIWGIAELLRGDYKQSEYGRVVLPLVVMRRLDQALEPTKQAVLDKVADLERRGIETWNGRCAAALAFSSSTSRR